MLSAAAAKSHQSCPTLCDPIDGSPPGFSVPGILQARTLSGVPLPSPSYMSYSVRPHRQEPTRLLCPWDSPGKNTGMGCWTLKNWCFQTVVLEKTLDNPLDIMEIKPVNSKANQSWLFIGSTDAEAETPILWPPNVKSIGKDPDAGKDWRKEEKGMTEDEMVGWHHSLNGHEFGQAPGDTICKASSNNHFAFLHFFFLGITKSQTQPSDWTATVFNVYEVMRHF